MRPVVGRAFIMHIYILSLEMIDDSHSSSCHLSFVLRSFFDSFRFFFIIIINKKLIYVEHFHL